MTLCKYNFLSILLLIGGVEAALAKVCLITDFGAVGDGITKATSAFEGAVKACSREPDFPFSDDNKNTVLVPTGGVFITGSFILASGIDLFVEQGAMILGSIELDDYPLIDILPSYGTGRDVDSDLRYQPLIFGQNLSYVSVSGDGIIDGNGSPWWEKHFKKELEWSRPPMIEFMYSAHITVQDLTLQNSAFWTVHPYASSEIVVQRLRILAPGYAPNTDGVDPDSCSNVLIQDCYFSVGDDGVAVKSGLNEYGREFGMPSQNILIRNITVDPQFDNLSTNGISIGSEMSGGVRNVTVQDVRIMGCEAGVYIKSMEGRGGVVEDVHFRDIQLNRTLQAIKIVMNYGYRRKLEEEKSDFTSSSSGVRAGSGSGDDYFPVFRDIHVQNVVGELCAQAGMIVGLPESHMDNITLTNVTIGSKLGFYCDHVSGSYTDVSPSLRRCFD